VKASFDFGNKMTIIAFLNTFEKQPEKWGFTYGDTLQFVL